MSKNIIQETLNYPNMLPLDCLFETYINGERRIHARARLREIKLGSFEVIPLNLKEFSGPNIKWDFPAKGEPIVTGMPITFDEAQGVLQFWAMPAIANCAARFR